MAGKIKAALLVDADNLPTSQAEEALEKLADICNPVIKKAFGDFTKSAKNWSPEFMRKHGFTPEMHFAVSNFKNGADIAMCIAAMDIVHAKSVEAIVLFTSDSDFASLAARIREAGMEVVGVGDAKASEVLRSAFDTFVIVDPSKKVETEPTKVAALKESAKALQSVSTQKPKKPVSKPAPAKAAKTIKASPSKHPLKIPSDIRAEIINAVTNLTPTGEPVLLAKVHAKIKERIPSFSFTDLNFANLNKLFRAIVELDVSKDNRKVRLVR